MRMHLSGIISNTHFTSHLYYMAVSIMEEFKPATVHGVFVGAVLPVKLSRNTPLRPYFESKVLMV